MDTTVISSFSIIFFHDNSVLIFSCLKTAEKNIFASNNFDRESDDPEAIFSFPFIIALLKNSSSPESNLIFSPLSFPA
jgi:hypothetical protein